MNTTDLRFASNKARDIEKLFATELAPLYPAGEIRIFVRMLFEAFIGWSHTDLLTRRDETVNQSDLLRFHWALQDLKRQRPIQHIIGYTDFCNCRIEVTKDTLIPRPETEEIVNQTISKISTLQNINTKTRILDLCTGSGCIAIALAKQWPEADVIAVDISNKALTVAKKNAETNNVKVNFLQADILQSPLSALRSPFSLIISNPPYVMDKEKASMQHNVLDWEPAEALFVPDSDPLIFYRAIANIAATHLASDGIIVLEINEQLGQETLRLFEEKGFYGTLCNDFRGKTRMIFLQKTDTSYTLHL